MDGVVLLIKIMNKTILNELNDHFSQFPLSNFTKVVVVDKFLIHLLPDF